MKRDKLLRSKGYHVTKIQNELFRELTAYMEQNNMNRTQLAKHLGVSKGYVSQILNGDFDYKLSKLVELSLAMGKAPKVSFIAFDELVKKGKVDKSKVVDFDKISVKNNSSYNKVIKFTTEEKHFEEIKLAN